MKLTISNASLSFALLFSALILVSSCAQNTQGPSATGADLPLQQAGQGQNQADQSAQGGGTIIEEGVIGQEGIMEPAPGSSIMEARTSAPFQPIYFDFNKYTIRPDMFDRMEHNAQVMKDHPDIKVEIQGNCDERGTNEYNLALGEKRAKAARDFLVNMGISPDRISIVSLGEEKPLDPGHNEKAWAKNRRDDFVIYR